MNLNLNIFKKKNNEYKLDESNLPQLSSIQQSPDEFAQKQIQEIPSQQIQTNQFNEMSNLQSFPNPNNNQNSQSFSNQTNFTNDACLSRIDNLYNEFLVFKNKAIKTNEKINLIYDMLLSEISEETKRKLKLDLMIEDDIERLARQQK